MTQTDWEVEPNLYTCPRCDAVFDLGSDDLAGDEDAVALRIAHTCWPDQLCECGHKRSSHSRDGRDGGLNGGGCLASFRPGDDGIARNDGCHTLNIPVGKYAPQVTAEQRMRRERGW